MNYSDFAIEQLKSRLQEKAFNSSTPRKAAGDMLEALEVIQQLQKASRELAQAEQEGRLVMLPCYTGDKVYMPILGRILELKVGSIVINGGVITIYYYSSSFRSSLDDFGKTVFLTREEAEAAMEKQKNTICKEE